MSWVPFVLPLVIGYLVTFGWIWDNWMLDDGYYSHGPLLPLLAAFLVWRMRPRLAGIPAGFDARGWWLLGPGLLLHVGAAALTVDSLSALSLCLTVPGIVMLVSGLRRTRALGSVIGLVFLAVPMPMFISGKLVFWLKEFAVDLGLGLGNLFGAEAVRVGANLFVPGDATPLVVADACGGLRSLVSLLTVGYVIAFCLSSARWPWRAVLLALALPIAIGSNVLRIAAMCVMSRHYGVEFGAGRGHDIANGVVWVLALVVLLGLDAWLSRRSP